MRELRYYQSHLLKVLSQISAQVDIWRAGVSAARRLRSRAPGTRVTTPAGCSIIGAVRT